MTRILPGLLLLTLLSCQKAEFEITDSTVHQEVQSASGLVVLGEDIFTVCDDNPYLFHLDSDFQILRQHALIPFDGPLEKVRLPKATKPDFEALEQIGPGEMIALGSGSETPERDIMIHIRIDGDSVETERYSITNFYDSLAQIAGMERSEFNLEGLAFSSNTLYFFTRTTNLMFTIDSRAFLIYMKEKGALPPVKFKTFELPGIDGSTSGFSGATVTSDGKYAFVTSSVEVSDDSYNDGDILGSFIGVVPLYSAPDKTHWARIESPEEPLKVEAISILNQLGENSYEVVLTTDSDGGGTSVFMRGLLSW